MSGDHVIIEWTLATTLTEPFYGGLSRKVPISLHGASIVHLENGKITDWSDYYDGLVSRRTAWLRISRSGSNSDRIRRSLFPGSCLHLGESRAMEAIRNQNGGSDGTRTGGLLRDTQVFLTKLNYARASGYLRK